MKHLNQIFAQHRLLNQNGIERESEFISLLLCFSITLNCDSTGFEKFLKSIVYPKSPVRVDRPASVRRAVTWGNSLACSSVEGCSLDV